MNKLHQSENKILVAVPAYNEEATIEAVVKRIRQALPDFDLLVINDGSLDGTGEILTRLQTVTATHVCNLGYGRAIQTAIKYAIQCGYDLLITLDADGQHSPEQIMDLLAVNQSGEWDMLIGSRYVATRDYSQAPLGRRIGMKIFSLMVRAISGQRIYDTTSGLKIIRRTAFESLTHWHFIDFHAEAIVYLLRLGYQIAEAPITAAKRTQGVSMYSRLSLITYPLKTSLILLLGVVEAGLTRRRKDK
ncbi:MAG: glycosyltransferase family 2 protein [Blastocatellales bacterium]